MCRYDAVQLHARMRQCTCVCELKRDSELGKMKHEVQRRNKRIWVCWNRHITCCCRIAHPARLPGKAVRSTAATHTPQRPRHHLTHAAALVLLHQLWMLQQRSACAGRCSCLRSPCTRSTPPTVMLADARKHAVLADVPLAVTLTGARASAVLALASLAARNNGRLV